MKVGRRVGKRDSKECLLSQRPGRVTRLDLPGKLWELVWRAHPMEGAGVFIHPLPGLWVTLLLAGVNYLAHAACFLERGRRAPGRGTLSETMMYLFVLGGTLGKKQQRHILSHSLPGKVK